MRIELLRIANDEKEMTVKIGTEVRTLRCYKPRADYFLVEGFAVRFPTGKKVWKGEVPFWIEKGKFGNATCSSMDVHGGRRNTMTLLGFYDMFAEQKTSQHLGNR